MPVNRGRLKAPQLASPPGSPVEGEIYYNTGAEKLYMYDGNSQDWIDLSASSGHQPCRVATTANISNYATGAPNTLDGVSLAVNDRVLMKDQTTGSQNGIFRVSTVGTGANGVWQRASDADTTYDLLAGDTVSVVEGTVNAGTIWMVTTPGPITINTTSITFVNKTGGTSGSNTMGVAVHGTNSSYARPTGYAQVLWIGTVVPNNADANDVFYDTDAGTYEPSMLPKEVFSAYLGANQNYTGSGGFQTLVFTSKDYDPSNAYSTSTGKYTAPRAGYYEFNAVFQRQAMATGNYEQMAFRKTILATGATFDKYVSLDALASAGYGYQANGAAQFYMEPGDTVHVMFASSINGNVDAGSTTTYFQGKMVSGDYAGSMTTPRFKAVRKSNSASIGSLSGALGFTDEITDTHNAFNHTSGVFTAPVSGTYVIQETVLINDTISTGTIVGLYGYKNGSLARQGERKGGSNGAAYDSVWFYDEVALSAGDTYEIRPFASGGASAWTAYGDSSGINTVIDGHLIRDDAAIPAASEAWKIVGSDGGLTSFQNSATAGASPPKYYKDPFGTVHLQGDITGMTANDVAAFTLPVGYRPGQLEAFAVRIYTPSVAETVGSIYIATDGTVKQGIPGSMSSTSQRWLSGITFRAEN